MKIKKWISILVLISIVTLFMTGCNNQEKGLIGRAIFFPWEINEDKHTSISETKTIRAAMFESPATEAAETLLKEYEKETGIKVEFDILPYDHLRSRIVFDFISGTGEYDIIMPDIIWVPEFAHNGWLHPIEENFEEYENNYNFDDLIPIVVDALGRYPKNKTLYGLPFMTNTHVLVYRNDLYEKYLEPKGIRRPGLTSEDAWTWDEYIEAAKLLTIDKTGNGEIDLWGSTLQARRGNSLVYEWFGYLFSFGGKDFDENMNPLFNSTESIDAISFYTSIYKEHKVAPRGVVSWAHAEETEALVQGLCAMSPTWNMELAYWLVDPQNSKFANEFRFAMKPKTEERSPTPNMGGYSLVISSNSKNKEEAFNFIKWISSPEIHKKIIMKGGTPFRYSVMEDEEVLEKFPFYTFYGEALETSIYRTRIPEWSKIEEILGRELSSAMLGQRTPEEAGQKINDEIKKII